jgi:hypothetical protein
MKHEISTRWLATPNRSHGYFPHRSESSHEYLNYHESEEFCACKWLYSTLRHMGLDYEACNGHHVTSIKSDLFLTRVFLVYVLEVTLNHIPLKLDVSKLGTSNLRSASVVELLYLIEDIHLIGVWFYEEQRTNVVKTHV